MTPTPSTGDGLIERLDLKAMSADVEDRRVLRLHFDGEVTRATREKIVDALNALVTIQTLQTERDALHAGLPKRIGRLELGERLSDNYYCSGSHDVPDGQPVYWQERFGEYPDDIDGYCLSCAIERAESDAGWCECSISAALNSNPNTSGEAK